MTDLPPPIPAATLIVMRPLRGGPPELLMMERPGHMVFAAGALVFPGGRIEPQDEALAESHGGGAELAARVAAIRETLEETGIALGFAAPLLPGAAAALREKLLAGTLFADALAERGLALAPEALTPFARWCPNFREARRFDATFFLAEAPSDTPEPTPQPGEASRAFWASAGDILGQLADDTAHAIFPTRRNLERLAGYASFEEARADAGRFPMRTIIPWIEEREGVAWLRIPDDLGYPVTAELLETARRR